MANTREAALEKAIEGKKLTKDWAVRKDTFKEKQSALDWKRGLNATGFTCKLQKDLTVIGVRPQCPKCQCTLNNIKEPCPNLNCK